MRRVQDCALDAVIHSICALVSKAGANTKCFVSSKDIIIQRLSFYCTIAVTTGTLDIWFGDADEVQPLAVENVPVGTAAAAKVVFNTTPKRVPAGTVISIGATSAAGNGTGIMCAEYTYADDPGLLSSRTVA